MNVVDERQTRLGFGARELADRVATAFGEVPGVCAVVVAGSHAGGTVDARSDIDLYVYADVEIPIPIKAEIEGHDALRMELDQRFWETSDAWIDADTGIAVDVMFRTPAWIEAELERVLVRHEAAVGHTTAIWGNVVASTPLVDREGWFAALQRWVDRPYPEELRRAIVAKNHPMLRDAMFSFLYQIEVAVNRRDALSVQHRLTALMASFFDVLFAMNRRPHPGEKGLVRQALLCPLCPANMEERIDGVLMALPPPWDGREERLPSRVHELVDRLDGLMTGEGLI